MSTELFPDGLTADAWHGLNHRLQNDEPALADKWAVRVSDLITIGVMRHVANPKTFAGVTFPGWTMWGQKKYSNAIHEEQQIALEQWASAQGVSIVCDVLPPEAPFGSVIYENLAFRDPDGLSAPSDATDLALGGWKLYTGKVIAPKGSDGNEPLAHQPTRRSRMGTELFPGGLTRTAWDDLEFRLAAANPEDVARADKWVVREADLIAIGRLRWPASHALVGWTRREWIFTPRIDAHVTQINALDHWAHSEGVHLQMDESDQSGPKGRVYYEGLYFRDPDGLSAPSDPSELEPGGWTLYTGRTSFYWLPPDKVRKGAPAAGALTSNQAPKVWTDADAVKTRDDGQPVEDPPGDAVTVKRPDDSALRPLRVGDDVRVWDHSDSVSTMLRFTIVRLEVLADGRRVALNPQGQSWVVTPQDRVVGEEG